MDEPASALDPVSTSKIEDLIFHSRSQYTIVIVTHNMQQAARVAEKTGFFLNGNMVEFDSTHKIFTNPSDKRTEDYITGRFGMTRITFSAESRWFEGTPAGDGGARGTGYSALHLGVSRRGTYDLRFGRLQSEPAINRLEREIDQMALDLLAMEQPMAIDLRFIMLGDLGSTPTWSGWATRRVRTSANRVRSWAERQCRAAGRYSSGWRRFRPLWCGRALQAFIEADADLARSVLQPWTTQVDEMNRACVPRAGHDTPGEKPWCALRV